MAGDRIVLQESGGAFLQKKYQIFVSSTFRDLGAERQDTIRSILDLGHIPAGMELFPASDTEQLEYIKRIIDECDYYILIIGGKYGSLDQEEISFTEREYDYAVETGKVVLAFPHGDLSSIPVGKSDTSERMKSNLAQFRTKVMSGRLVREWSTREQLEAAVVKSLVRAIADYPAEGWVRGNTAASEDILSQINTVRAENDALRIKVQELSAQILPKFESLAEYDETIAINYRYTTYHRHERQSLQGHMNVSWRDLIRYICPEFMQPRPRSAISSALATYGREIKGFSYLLTFFSTDVDSIANQLIALGLLSSYQAKSTNGGVTEFLILTEMGTNTVLDFSAVRTAKTAD